MISLVGQGRGLYSSIYIFIYSGFFRMLPIKDFGAEIKAGYGLEILFQLIPMLVIQHLNSDN